jgi:hypothetical protein
MSETCEHRFVYAGLRYVDGRMPRPGSGAVTTHYGHAYHCEACLEPRVEAVHDGDRNSYQPRLAGSQPASFREAQLLLGGR